MNPSGSGMFSRQRNLLALDHAVLYKVDEKAFVMGMEDEWQIRDLHDVRNAVEGNFNAILEWSYTKQLEPVTKASIGTFNIEHICKKVLRVSKEIIQNWLQKNLKSNSLMRILHC